MQKIIPNLLSITPNELYLQRINAMYDTLRKSNKNIDYTPCQFGGILGQRLVSQGSVVLEVTNFEIT